MGGNVALDCATSAIKLGAKTSKIIYRRTENEMKTSIDEYNLAIENNVLFECLSLPVKFLGNDKIEEIECIKMKLGDVDESGRRSPVEIKDSNYNIKADIIVFAIGCMIEDNDIDLIEIDNRNKIINVNEKYQTSIPNIFTGGDCATKERTVTFASHMGIEAAKQIINYLKNN